MKRVFPLESAPGRTAWILMILVIFTLPNSAAWALNSQLPESGQPARSAEPQIPNWEPPLDPNYSMWENVPVTYDPNNGAVKQGRFPECKTCLPDETDYNKPENPPGWPETATVKVITQWPSGDETECSGMLVDSAVIVTAGHCVFSFKPALCEGESSCWCSDLQVFLKYQQEGEQQSGYTQLLSWTAWTENRDFRYDLAGVKLEHPLGNAVGWLGFGYNNDKQGQFFPTAGFEYTSYPADPGSEITQWSGNFTTIEEHHFFSDGLSAYGQGGAGAHSNENSHIIFSVLSHLTVDTPSQTGHTRITPDKFYALRDWIQGSIKDKNFMIFMPYFKD